MHEIWNVVEKQSMHPQLASDHSQSQTAGLDALFVAGVTHILNLGGGALFSRARNYGKPRAHLSSPFSHVFWTIFHLSDLFFLVLITGGSTTCGWMEQHAGVKTDPLF